LLHALGTWVLVAVSAAFLGHRVLSARRRALDRELATVRATARAGRGLRAGPRRAVERAAMGRNAKQAQTLERND
jgi:hypothetical protein